MTNNTQSQYGDGCNEKLEGGTGAEGSQTNGSNPFTIEFADDRTGGGQRVTLTDKELNWWIEDRCPTQNEAADQSLVETFVKRAILRNVDENSIVKVCLDGEPPRGGRIFRYVRDHGSEPCIKKIIKDIANEITPPPGEKRTILLQRRGRDTDVHWRTVEQTVKAAQCPVFVRNGRLVWPHWEWHQNTDDEGNRSYVLSAELEEYTLIQLTDMVAHHAVRFRLYDKRVREYLDIDPPNDIMAACHGAHHYSLYNIVGIITSPTIRKNGSILDTPGYDEATQLWYKSSDNIKLPVIPESPTRDDALAALKILDDLLDDFPFEDEISRSAAMAGILTTVCRGALDGAVPLFVVTAPDARTGKTYLVNLIALIATGHIPVSVAGAEKKEEFEKRVETAAMSGRAILHLNNLPNGMLVESDRLAELATEGKVTIRKLGRHEEGVCDCRATTGFLNGNNISLAADLVPRSVTCRLDRKSEHPEQHTFKTNPMELVRADRGKYLAAVFTLVKAFRSAKISVKLEDDKAFIEIDGTRTEMKHVAGFEQWSKLVQAALIWLGMKDPMGAMERTRALDETQEEVVHLLDTLYSAFDNSPFNVIDCKNRADAGNQAFKELMANKKGEVDTRAFGQKLRRSRNKVRGRLSLVLDESDHEGSKWKIAGSRPL